VPPEEAFRFFTDPQNLEAITPPWLSFRIVEAPDRLVGGSLLRYRLRLFGVPIHWRTRILDWRPPRSFTDLQLRGPYALWEHTHRLSPAAGGTEIHDHIRYRIALGPVGRLVQRLLVRRCLDEIFDYRAERMRELFAPAATGRGGTSTEKDARSA
jgi:ligand-binding SRPBCC domain-containing protein